MNSIDDIRIKTVPRHTDNLGFLVSFEADAGFRIDFRRVFVVSGPVGATRGKHAHKTLTQVLVCLHGACRVTCDDGEAKQEVLLNSPEIALQVPPGIWAVQYYADPDTMLMVLCDMPFDEGDYIRDYDEFIAFRKGNHA